MKKLLIILAAAIGLAAIARAATIDLSQVTSDTTLEDGDVAIGKLKNGYNVSIAKGATVTLAYADITGTGKWPGIKCLGGATIIIEGTNNVSPDINHDFPGIFVRDMYTLTIKGNGVLAANGGFFSGAAIGSGGSLYSEDEDEWMVSVGGNIVIESGTIIAKGGRVSAAIGCGEYNQCGSITINGGTVIATGGGWSPGIGCGYHGMGKGDITINGGTVIATAGVGAAGIGTGEYGYLDANIVINGGTVIATAGSGGAAIGTGDNGFCGDITIIGGTVTATGGSVGIGCGDASTAENITITEGVVSVTASSKTRAVIGYIHGDGFVSGTIKVGENIGCIESQYPYTYYGKGTDQPWQPPADAWVYAGVEGTLHFNTNSCDHAQIGRLTAEPSGVLVVPTEIDGKAVAGIGAHAFFNYGNLTGVMFEGDAPSVGEGAFEGVADDFAAYLPKGNETYEVVDGMWQGVKAVWYDEEAEGPIVTANDIGMKVLKTSSGTTSARKAIVPEGTDAEAIKVSVGGKDVTKGFSRRVEGKLATIELLAPYEVPREEAADAPWTEDGEGKVTLNVEVVPGLYYAAASAASLDALKCPGADSPATAETTLVVAKPESDTQGFYKVWVSDRAIEAE